MISILKKVVLNDILQNKVLSSTLLLLPHLSVSAYLLLDVISWFKSTTIFLKEIVALPMFYLHFWIIFLCIFLNGSFNFEFMQFFYIKKLLMPDLNGPRNDKLNRMKSWLLCISMRRWMIQNISAKFFKLWTSFRSRCELLLGPKSYVMCHMYVLPHQCLEWPNLHK